MKVGKAGTTERLQTMPPNTSFLYTAMLEMYALNFEELP